VLDPVAVVFAGGQGTRLWPLSRQRTPKQFQPIAHDVSLVAAAIERLRKLIPADRILVSTSAEFADAARRSLGDVPEENLVLEEGRKGSVAAFALALAIVHERYGDAPMFTCASDHVIQGETAFQNAVAEMLDLVTDDAGLLVALGAVPSRPDSTLGYLRTDSRADRGPVEVLELVEKPHPAVAADLIAHGSVYWNTACYALRAGTGLAAYRVRRPEVMRAAEEHVRSGTTAAYDGPTSPGQELYPFFEDGLRTLVVSREFGWNDVGTWPRLESVLGTELVPDLGPAVMCDAPDVVVASMDGRPVVALGVRGLVIVTHEDAVYVLDKQKAGDVVALEQLRTMLGDTRKDLL
jgi:mannose-1-phosphate guanylyltransferase